MWTSNDQMIRWKFDLQNNWIMYCQCSIIYSELWINSIRIYFTPLEKNDHIRSTTKNISKLFFFLRFRLKIAFHFDYFGKYEMEINMNFEGFQFAGACHVKGLKGKFTRWWHCDACLHYRSLNQRLFPEYKLIIPSKRWKHRMLFVAILF